MNQRKVSNSPPVLMDFFETSTHKKEHNLIPDVRGPSNRLKLFSNYQINKKIKVVSFEI